MRDGAVGAGEAGAPCEDRANPSFIGAGMRVFRSLAATLRRQVSRG